VGDFPRKVPQSTRRSMKICNNYFVAKNVVDAVQVLEESQDSAKVIAGGTDLLLDIQQSRLEPPEILVDVTQIPEMQALEIRNERLFIGAAVSHNRISESELVINNSQALSEASGLIGGPQVRNVASLGGNVGHALPAADGTIALMSLDAQVEIASTRGRRSAPLVSLFHSPGKNTLAKGELITGFTLPLGLAQQASAFRRVMRPQGVAIAILNCSVWLERDNDRIKDIRISIGPSGPVPRRMTLSEESLRGRTPSPQALNQAVEAVMDEANFRTSRHRASQQYRLKVMDVLLRACVETAWKRVDEEVMING